MRLSEMTTDQLADALVELSAPVGRICQDDKVIELLRRYTAPEQRKAPMLKAIGDVAAALCPALLKDHRHDLYLVLSVMTGKSVQEIASQRGVQTIADVRNCWDRELTDFFSLSADTALKK